MAVVAVGMAAYGAATWAGFAAYAGMAATVAMSAYSMWETSKQVIKSEGPRLNDLRVMSSTYGGDLPVIYGTMRVKGEVIWKPNIIEVATTQSRGGKGGGPKQTSTTYSYYANFAVALAQGEVSAVRRIWANGKLIYDVGYPENPTEQNMKALAEKISASSFVNFRFYNGSETQAPDPLIEAYEGVGNTPAYRGTAYIVFERLPLADYGNQLPNINVEISNGVFHSLAKLVKISHPPEVVRTPTTDGFLSVSPFFTVNKRHGVTTYGYYNGGGGGWAAPATSILMVDYNARGEPIRKNTIRQTDRQLMLQVANGSKNQLAPRYVSTTPRDDGYWSFTYPSPIIEVENGMYWTAAYNPYTTPVNQIKMSKFSSRGVEEISFVAPFPHAWASAWTLSWSGADLIAISSREDPTGRCIIFKNSDGSQVYNGTWAALVNETAGFSNCLPALTPTHIVLQKIRSRVCVYTYKFRNNQIVDVVKVGEAVNEVGNSADHQFAVNGNLIFGEYIHSLLPLIEQKPVLLSFVLKDLLSPLNVDTTEVESVYVKGYSATERGRGGVEPLCAAYGFDLVEDGDGEVRVVKRKTIPVKVIDEGDTINES